MKYRITKSHKGYRALVCKETDSETTYYSKRKTFNSNIIEVISKYRVSGINAEVASQVVSSIIKQCNQNKSIPKEEIDSIGDEFISNYIQSCSAFNPK